MTYIQNVWGRMVTGMKLAFVRDEGVTAIEYGLIAALIAVVKIAAISRLGIELNTTFGRVNRRYLTRIREAGEDERSQEASLTSWSQAAPWSGRLRMA